LTIELRQVSKRWERVVAAQDVSLVVQPGELVTLLGPSGSGKTTLLQIMAGLVRPDAGCILFSGRDVSNVGVRNRGVGFVFQHYALFRHMSVFENVAFGLRVLPWRQRPNRRAIEARVEELLSLVQLEGMGDRRPTQLSGGQRQRVALARALAVKPDVLLLDEPFGALDQKVREELRRWLRRLHDRLHVTSVLVTHDQSEALEIADRVVVMNQGRLEQVGSPQEVLDHPASAFVNEFMGEVNALSGRVVDGQAQVGALRITAPGFRDGDTVRVMVRNYDVALTRDDAGSGKVERLSILGDRVKVMVHLEGVGLVVAQLPREAETLRGIEAGCRVTLAVRGARVYPRPDHFWSEAGHVEGH
jgi:sulfate transport system ATP-binding protein